MQSARSACAASLAVRSARSFYRLNVGVGAVALLAVAVGLGVSLRAIDFSGLSLADVAAACRRVLLPGVSVAGVLVLLLASVSLAVLGLGVRSLVRQLRTRRDFVRGVRVIGSPVGCPHGTLLIEDPRPQAFCTGYLRPRVYVSTGTLELLDEAEAGAVLAHEEHHAFRRDPLRMLLVEVLGDALFFLPIMRRLRERYRTLAELAADEAALGAAGEAAPLASALLTFGQTSQPGVVGIAPERVDHLLGERPRWELPVSVLVGALVTIAVLILFVASAAKAAGPGHVSLPVLTAQACMVVMTAFPIVFGAGLLLLTKRMVGVAGR